MSAKRFGLSNAFTLIELLVVIAIIATIAAIIFPVFAVARMTAQKTVCMSNEKQIALCIMMYIQDCDERTPRAVNNASTSRKLTVTATPQVAGDNAFLPADTAQGRITGFLFPYVKNVQVWRCPSDPVTWDPSVLSPNGSLSIANATSYHLSIYLTGSMVDVNNEITSGDGVANAAVPIISQTILVRDGDASDGTNVENLNAVGGALIGEQLYTKHSDHTQGVRHGGKGNYIMLDGHVKTLAPSQVSPMAADDDPDHPCPGCADQVNPEAEAFWNIVQ